MIEIKDSGNENDWHSIRECVFIKEQGFQNEFDDIDKFALHVVLYVEHKAIGCGRIYPDKEDAALWHLGRLAIKKAYRSCGYGAAIIHALEERARKKGARKILLSAQQHAIPFYQRNGYTPYGETYLDEHVPHQMMKKVL